MFVKESDKIIVSELLFYIQNRIKCISKDILVVLCAKTFSAEEIKVEKAKFFDSNNVRTTERKKGPEQLSRNLHDIVDKMIELDNSGSDATPVFVARDFSKLPKTDESSSDNSASFEVLINSVQSLAASVRSVESQMVTQKCMNEMLNVLPSICLRGSGVPSSPRRRMPPDPPVALSSSNLWVTNSSGPLSSSLTLPPVAAPRPSPIAAPTVAPSDVASSVAASATQTAPLFSALSASAPSFSPPSASAPSVTTLSVSASSVAASSVATSSVSTSSVSTPSVSTPSVSTSSVSTSSVSTSSTATSSVSASSGSASSGSASSDGFVRVNRRQRKSNSDGPRQRVAHRSQSRPRRQNNLVVGRKVVDGLVSCRGADLTCSVYLGHFDNSSTYDAVKTSIESQNVTVIELEELKLNHCRFKSFRLCLKKDSMAKILDPDFWPSGVVVRRFWRGKTPQTPTAPTQ